MHHVTMGNKVITADGTELGTVKEVQGDVFKVDAPMAMDYWLRCDCAANEMLGDGVVRLTLLESELNDNKVDAPA